MDDCLFCKMVSREIPSNIVFENDSVLAFRDIDPKAPTHILVIPKKHIQSINELGPDDQSLAGEILLAAKTIAKAEGIETSGFRTVFNTNDDGGQTVFHIHMHVLGGRRLSWPPG
jgi:histidine triad (HIT) family protein|tara:strand:+ start:1445 stop:1789 length:345 start_codon:yes stop_codon:yes gene_type:complete